MVFSSFTFLCYFLPFVLLGYFLCPSLKIKNLFLLGVSLIFYAWGEPKYLFVMVSVIFLSYVGALCIHQVKRHFYKKIVLFFFLILLFSSLFYFKYFNFTVQILTDIFHQHIDFVKVILPIGISFYTFQAVSYVVDVYRGGIPQKGFLNLALYISMFPQLVAGPIVKYQTIEQQLTTREHTVNDVYEGILRFIMGLSKKILIADTLAVSVDKIFDTPVPELSFPVVWMGIIFYALQIYFDFSGYSDMAIGLGRVFGFKFLENFNYPYVSKSITEFWRRWHISLSSWFKEYVYISLGGSWQGLRKTLRNLLIVFFLTGLWHGAEYTFIVWGLWHGFFIMGEKIISKGLILFHLSRIFEKLKIILKPLLSIYTLLVIFIGWVFFRAKNMDSAILYIKALFNQIDFSPDFTLAYYVSGSAWIIFFISLLLAMGYGKKILDFSQKYQTTKILRDITLFLSFLLCIIFLTGSSYSPFIYFRF
ncbi:MAG: MBOAT family protein [Alphaproteobacteria bacterium]|nr:MBOAT family protein [Alphaproteobacteria bacterium]